MDVKDEIVEIEHKQWAHWTKYMLDNLTTENIERWQRQIKTSYSELSEKEKDSDKKWADIVLSTPIGVEVEVECPKCEGTPTNHCSKELCDNYFYDKGMGCSEKGNCPAEECTGIIKRPAIIQDAIAEYIKNHGEGKCSG